MAVSLPTAADVRKAREQAAERAEVVRTPLLAVLGAGDLAVTAVTKAVTDARARATERQERVGALPAQLGALPAQLNAEELKKLVAELRVQAEKVYAEFASRGEQAWERLSAQPQFEQALTTLQGYTGKFDATVDGFVDDAHDAAEKALAAVTTQTRSTGERVARATQRFTGRTASAVVDAAADTADAVEKAGAEVAGTITEAGAEVAHEARSTSRKAAAKVTPKATTTRKPAARRTTNGEKSGS